VEGVATFEADVLANMRAVLSALLCGHRGELGEFENKFRRKLENINE
jgi:hypothetical protein